MKYKRSRADPPAGMADRIAGLFKALARREQLQHTARDAAEEKENAEEQEKETRKELEEVQQRLATASDAAVRASEHSEQVAASLAAAGAEATATESGFAAAGAAEAAPDRALQDRWMEKIQLTDENKAREWCLQVWKP